MADIRTQPFLSEAASIPVWAVEANKATTDLPLMPEFEVVFSGPDITLNRTRYAAVLESFVKQVEDRAAAGQHIPVHLGHPSMLQDHVPVHQQCGIALSARMENGNAIFRGRLGAIRDEGAFIAIPAARQAYAMGQSGLLAGTSVVCYPTKAKRITPDPVNNEERGYMDVTEAELLAIDFVDIPANRAARTQVAFEAAFAGCMVEETQPDSETEEAAMAFTEEQLKALLEGVTAPIIAALENLTTKVDGLEPKKESPAPPPPLQSAEETPVTAPTTESIVAAVVEALDLDGKLEAIKQSQFEAAQGTHRATVDAPPADEIPAEQATPKNYVSSEAARIARESVQGRRADNYA